MKKLNNQVDRKNFLTPQKKLSLLISIIAIIIIFVIGNIVSTAFHLPRNTGLCPTIIFLLAIAPVSNILYLGIQYADNKKEIFLKLFLFLFLIIFNICSISFIVINIVHML